MVLLPRNRPQQSPFDALLAIVSSFNAWPLFSRVTAAMLRCSSCKQSQELGRHQKRGRLDFNILETVLQNCHAARLHQTQWQSLTTKAIYMALSRLMLSWGLEDGSEQSRQLQNHTILRHLDIEHDLHQWLRSIMERRNVDGYNSFFAEVQAKQGTGKHTRRSGERGSSIAQIEYLAHIYADRTNATDTLDRVTSASTQWL